MTVTRIGLDLLAGDRVFSLRGGRVSMDPEHASIALTGTPGTPTGETRKAGIQIHDGQSRSLVRYSRTRMFFLLAPDHQEFRDILAGFGAAGITEMSATIEVTGYHAAADSPADPNDFIEEEVTGFGFGIRIGA